jgi:hypothetical protein
MTMLNKVRKPWNYWLADEFKHHDGICECKTLVFAEIRFFFQLKVDQIDLLLMERT